MNPKPSAILYPQYENMQAKIERSLDKPGILPANKKHIIDFLLACQAKGLSNARISFYMMRMPRLAKYFKKDFTKLDRKDIEQFLVSSGLGGWGRDAYVVTFQQLFRFLFGLESSDPLPEAIRHIKRSPEPNKLTTNDLLTDKELDGLIKAADDVKTKAIFAMLAYGGLRPGELRALKFKNVVIRGSVMEVTVASGKTSGKVSPRVVPICKGIDLVKAWMDSHPSKSGDSWLFTNKIDPRKPLSQFELSSRIVRCGERAGIRKRLNPYIFRHIRASQLYGSLPSEVVGRILGHDPEQGKTYAHLNNNQLIEAVMKFDGTVVDEKEELLNLLAEVLGNDSDSIRKNLELMRDVKRMVVESKMRSEYKKQSRS